MTVMPQPSLPDPLSFWRDLITQVETGVNEIAHAGMKSEDLRRFAGQVRDADAARRRLTESVLKRYLAALELPTRGEVRALDERLQHIEDLLVGIAAAVDALPGSQAGGRAAPGASPSRTRKAPSEGEAPILPTSGPARTAPRRKQSKRRSA